MKIIICPDSFKGTLSAREVCDCIEEGVLDALPNAETIKIPIADGGEGSSDVMGVKKKYTEVSGPYFEKTEAFIGFLGEERAVVEMAVCAGLPLVGERKHPRLTTTYGVGELIKAALDDGAKEILLCLGGSATNDAGCGMAAALGARFTDKNGTEFIPTGGTLKDIDKIDLSSLDPRLKTVKLSAMCDVKNPLFGENGAAFVYAPQKGADEETVKLLDSGLHHFSDKCHECLSVDVSALEGGGAAGGMGAGVVALLGGSLMRGIDAVLGICGFSEAVKGADLVITGEGRFDSQSLCGKVVSGVGEHMKDSSAPLLVIAGSIDRKMTDLGRVTAAFSIQTEPLAFEEAVKYSREGLRFTARNAVSLLFGGRS